MSHFKIMFKTSSRLWTWKWIVLWMWIVQSSSELMPQSTTVGDTTSQEPAGTRTVSPRDSKHALANMLHYDGLEDPPSSTVNDTIPDYIQLAYEALDALESEGWRQNQRTRSRKEIDQTIWGIQTHKVTMDRNGGQLKFMLQTEVLRVNISRAELVFPRPNSNRRNHFRFLRTTHHLSVCSDKVVSNHCGTNVSPRSDTIHINGKFYHIYNITAPFATWLTQIGSSSTSFPVYVTIPSRENYVRWNQRGLHGREGPLLVLFSNVHHLALEQYILPSFNHAAGNTRHSSNRFRRNLHPTLNPSVTNMNGQPSTPRVQNNQLEDPPFCSLVNWYVDFSIIGWNSFIYKPNGYSGNLCIGSCDIAILGNHVNITNHAFIKNLYEQEMRYGDRTDLGRVPSVTCVPIRIHPISILFRSGNNTYVNRRLHDMSVTGCGCL